MPHFRHFYCYIWFRIRIQSSVFDFWFRKLINIVWFSNIFLHYYYYFHNSISKSHKFHYITDRITTIQAADIVDIVIINFVCWTCVVCVCIKVCRLPAIGQSGNPSRKKNNHHNQYGRAIFDAHNGKIICCRLFSFRRGHDEMILLWWDGRPCTKQQNYHR